VGDVHFCISGSYKRLQVVFLNEPIIEIYKHNFFFLKFRLGGDSKPIRLLYMVKPRVVLHHFESLALERFQLCFLITNSMPQATGIVLKSQQNFL
jgi:hypothetical protein